MPVKYICEAGEHPATHEIYEEQRYDAHLLYCWAHLLALLGKRGSRWHNIKFIVRKIPNA